MQERILWATSAEPWLDRYGVELVQEMICRFRASLPDFPDTPWIAPGPGFDYSLGYTLFSGRSGHGPLRIAWDTNLLSDYFQYGKLLWRGESLPEHVPNEQGDELEGLQIVIALGAPRHSLPYRARRNC